MWWYIKKWNPSHNFISKIYIDKKDYDKLTDTQKSNKNYLVKQSKNYSVFRYKYKTFNKYPAAVQPISRGLRVNVIVHKNIVTYRDKEGNNIEGWNIHDEQFVNLAQNNSTVFDGHAVVVNGTTIVETDNQKVLELENN